MSAIFRIWLVMVAVITAFPLLAWAGTRTISGTITYSGAKQGRIFITAKSVPSGWTYGTSLEKPGDFQIRGVDASEDYEVRAYMDTHRTRTRYASDPLSTIAFVEAGWPNYKNADLELLDQTGVLCSGPTFYEVVPADNGIIVRVAGGRCGNGGSPDGYNVYWTEVEESGEPQNKESLQGKKYIPVDSSGAFLQIPNGKNISLRATMVTAGREGVVTAYDRSVTAGSPGGDIILSGTIKVPPSAVGKTAYLKVSNGWSGNAVIKAVRLSSTKSTFALRAVASTDWRIAGFIDTNGNQIFDSWEPQIWETTYGSLPGGITEGIELTAAIGQSVPTKKPTASIQTDITKYGQYDQRYGLNFYALDYSNDLVQATLVEGPNITGPVDIAPVGNWVRDIAMQQVTLPVTGESVFGAHVATVKPPSDQSYSVRLQRENGSVEVVHPVPTSSSDVPTAVEPLGLMEFLPYQVFRWHGDGYSTGFYRLNLLPNKFFPFGVSNYYLDPLEYRDGTYTATPKAFNPSMSGRETWSVRTVDGLGNIYTFIAPFYYSLGEIAGSVMDQSALAVPGARVTVKDVDAAATVTETTTDSAGKFQVKNLAPGEYRLCYEANGFPRQCRTEYISGGAVTETFHELEFELETPPPPPAIENITINSGNRFASLLNIPISIAATDPAGATPYCEINWDGEHYSDGDLYWDGDDCSSLTEVSIPWRNNTIPIDGPHTVYVRAYSYESDGFSVITSATIYLDTTPPVAAVSKGPKSVSKETDATFRIGGEDVVAYMAVVDGDNYSQETDVKVPFQLSGLSYGDHVLYVRGRDAAGNWQTEPTAYTWHVDAPLAVVTTTAAPRTYTVGGLGVTMYRYKLPGKGFSKPFPVSAPFTVPPTVKGVVGIQGRSGSGTWQKGTTTLNVN